MLNLKKPSCFFCCWVFLVSSQKQNKTGHSVGSYISTRINANTTAVTYFAVYLTACVACIISLLHATSSGSGIGPKSSRHVGYMKVVGVRWCSIVLLWTLENPEIPDKTPDIQLYSVLCGDRWQLLRQHRVLAVQSVVQRTSCLSCKV